MLIATLLDTPIPTNDPSPDEEQLALTVAQLEERNRHFEAMPPAQKRVAIAKDVLDWLGLGRITAQAGTYMLQELPGEWDGTGWTLPRGGGNGVGQIDGRNCSACAIGSVFAALTEHEPLSCGLNVCSDDTMLELLGKYFERDQLLDIEMAFEGFPCHPGRTNKAATRFCRRIDKFAVGGSARRMQKIMKNIIDNGGTFVP